MLVDQSEVASVAAASFRQDSVMAEPQPPKGCCGMMMTTNSDAKKEADDCFAAPCAKAYPMTATEERVNKRFDEEDDSSSSDDEEETKGEARHKSGKRHHRGNRQGKKGKRALPMKKVYKKLIQRELDRQAPQILE